MTPAVALDRQLADWRARADAMAQNLTEFRELPAYKRLAGAPGVPRVQLSGLTAKKIDPLLDRMGELFEWLSLLYSLLDRCEAMRKDRGGIFGGPDRTPEIQNLLNTPSITLPPLRDSSDPMAAPGQETKVTPAMLIEAMTRGFDYVKQIVIDLDDAWQHLTEHFLEADKEINSLREAGAGPSRNQLEMIRAQIAPLKDLIEKDPLGAAEEFDRKVARPLSQIRSTLQEELRVRREATDAVAEARKLLAQIEDIARQAAEARAEAEVRIADASVLKNPPAAELHALREWIDRLENKIADGLARPVLVGIEHWNQKARLLMAETQNAVTANQVPVLARRELRGRLLALKAKAQAKGCSEDPRLSHLAAEATALLEGRPTPMDRAQELVVLYERLLNGR